MDLNKVLWNNEMNFCVGLITELECQEFIEEAKKSHLNLTGESLIEGSFSIEKVPYNLIGDLRYYKKGVIYESYG